MEEKINMPLLGDKFPEIQVKTTQGMMTLPNDMAGKWFVLFSHPADFTPVCTTEFVGFQKRMEQFKEMDCALIGLSIDQVFSHIKWIEWIKDNLDIDIEFPIIAANDAIAYKIGLLHPGKGTNTVRAVFVVDPEGNVRLILYYPQEIGRNMDEIVRAVKALQLADKKGLAVPANWPNNELIGDHVIIPPASDMKTVKERKEDKTIECFDWWFCHKEDK
jgi:peroxiredoxin 2/4